MIIINPDIRKNEYSISIYAEGGLPENDTLFKDASSSEELVNLNKITTSLGAILEFDDSIPGIRIIFPINA